MQVFADDSMIGAIEDVLDYPGNKVYVVKGEQEYMRLIAEAFNTDDKKEFYEFIIALDALKKSLSGGATTVILGQDSALASILTGPNFNIGG